MTRAVDFAAVTERSNWSAKIDPGKFDLIHAFTTSGAELNSCLAGLQAALKQDGAVWVSWPKKALKAVTDVSEDRIREAALALDLVDVKVAAIDATWSGLKLVIRKRRRKPGAFPIPARAPAS